MSRVAGVFAVAFFWSSSALVPDVCAVLLIVIDKEEAAALIIILEQEADARNSAGQAASASQVDEDKAPDSKDSKSDTEE